MSDEEFKLTRRLFLQHAAMASAMSGVVGGIALKTDALAQVDDLSPAALRDNDPSQYPYLDPPA
jgi:hypothetical protein